MCPPYVPCSRGGLASAMSRLQNLLTASRQIAAEDGSQERLLAAPPHSQAAFEHHSMQEQSSAGGAAAGEADGQTFLRAAAFNIQRLLRARMHAEGAELRLRPVPRTDAFLRYSSQEVFPLQEQHSQAASLEL